MHLRSEATVFGPNARLKHEDVVTGLGQQELMNMGFFFVFLLG